MRSGLRLHGFSLESRATSLLKRTADFHPTRLAVGKCPRRINTTPCEVYANTHRIITDIMGTSIRILNKFKLAVQEL
jgi:hypothetical protein